MTDNLLLSSALLHLTALRSARLSLWQQEAVHPINHAWLGSLGKATTRSNPQSDRISTALTAIEDFDRAFCPDVFAKTQAAEMATGTSCGLPQFGKERRDSPGCR